MHVHCTCTSPFLRHWSVLSFLLVRVPFVSSNTRASTCFYQYAYIFYYAQLQEIRNCDDNISALQLGFLLCVLCTLIWEHLLGNAMCLLCVNFFPSNSQYSVRASICTFMQIICTFVQNNCTFMQNICTSWRLQVYMLTWILLKYNNIPTYILLVNARNIFRVSANICSFMRRT